ncbi:hypothetical protein [Kitasatospora acidiphila]
MDSEEQIKRARRAFWTTVLTGACSQVVLGVLKILIAHYGG